MTITRANSWLVLYFNWRYCITYNFAHAPRDKHEATLRNITPRLEKKSLNVATISNQATWTFDSLMSSDRNHLKKGPCPFSPGQKKVHKSSWGKARLVHLSHSNEVHNCRFIKHRVEVDVNSGCILGPVETLLCALCSATAGVGWGDICPPNEICHYEEFMWHKRGDSQKLPHCCSVIT